MLKALDTDGSGSISYSEFIGGFALVDTRGGGAGAAPGTPSDSSSSRGMSVDGGSSAHAPSPAVAPVLPASRRK